MKPTSQQYAILSNEGYVDHKVGKRSPGDRERVDVGGESYEILEHVNNPKTDTRAPFISAWVAEILLSRTEGPRRSIAMRCKPMVLWFFSAPTRRLKMR